jgi:hypothetical protein
MADELDAEIETAAEALRASETFPHYCRPWEFTPDKERDWWRAKARAARDASASR